MKKTENAQNWQVQDIDGTAVSDHGTEELAKMAAQVMTLNYQAPFRVRRTA